MGRHVYFGVALAKGHGARTAAHALGELPHQQLADGNEQHHGQNPAQQELQQRRILLGNHLAKVNARIAHVLHQVRVVDFTGGEYAAGAVHRRHEGDGVVVDLRFLNDFGVQHVQKITVGYLANGGLVDGRHQQGIDEKDHKDGNHVVENQWLFRGLHFVVGVQD